MKVCHTIFSLLSSNSVDVVLENVIAIHMSNHWNRLCESLTFKKTDVPWRLIHHDPSAKVGQLFCAAYVGTVRLIPLSIVGVVFGPFN